MERWASAPAVLQAALSPALLSLGPGKYWESQGCPSRAVARHKTAQKPGHLWAGHPLQQRPDEPHELRAATSPSLLLAQPRCPSAYLAPRVGKHKGKHPLRHHQLCGPHPKFFSRDRVVRGGQQRLRRVSDGKVRRQDSTDFSGDPVHPRQPPHRGPSSPQQETGGGRAGTGLHFPAAPCTAVCRELSRTRPRSCRRAPGARGRPRSWVRTDGEQGGRARGHSAARARSPALGYLRSEGHGRPAERARGPGRSSGRSGP